MNPHNRICGLLVFAILLFSGCVNPPVEMLVRRAEGDTPVPGVRVQQVRPRSWVEKLFNPVGAAYHPERIVHDHVTDDQGRFRFQSVQPHDRILIWVYPDQADP